MKITDKILEKKGVTEIKKEKRNEIQAAELVEKKKPSEVSDRRRTNKIEEKKEGEILEKKNLEGTGENNKSTTVLRNTL